MYKCQLNNGQKRKMKSGVHATLVENHQKVNQKILVDHKRYVTFRLEMLILALDNKICEYKHWQFSLIFITDSFEFLVFKLSDMIL